MFGLRAGSTLRRFTVKVSRFGAYCEVLVLQVADGAGLKDNNVGARFVETGGRNNAGGS
jgi:hypothetical protein